MKPVCSECGNYRKEVYSPNGTAREHRVCRSCRDGSTFILDYVKREELKFAAMSDIGAKWMKKIIKKPQILSADTTQHDLFTEDFFR